MKKKSSPFSSEEDAKCTNCTVRILLYGAWNMEYEECIPFVRRLSFVVDCLEMNSKSEKQLKLITRTNLKR